MPQNHYGFIPHRPVYHVTVTPEIVNDNTGDNDLSGVWEDYGDLNAYLQEEYSTEIRHDDCLALLRLSEAGDYHTFKMFGSTFRVDYW